MSSWNRKLQRNPLKKTQQKWMFITYIPFKYAKYWNLGPSPPPPPPFRNKIVKKCYGPSKTQKDEKCIKIGWKYKKFKFVNPFYVKNSNSYIIMLCMFLKEMFFRDALKKILIIYIHTLFDTFMPLFSFVNFWSTK